MSPTSGSVPDSPISTGVSLFVVTVLASAIGELLLGGGVLLPS